VITRLNELHRGQKARVTGKNGSPETIDLLASFGLIKGSEIIMESYSALDEPVEIKTSSRDLSLRREVAAGIEVEPLNQPLSQVGSGQTLVVSNIIAGPDEKRRLSDMGLTPNI
jgi:Fe2+ transport system protein FeoA